MHISSIAMLITTAAAASPSAAFRDLPDDNVLDIIARIKTLKDLVVFSRLNNASLQATQSSIFKFVKVCNVDPKTGLWPTLVVNVANIPSDKTQQECISQINHYGMLYNGRIQIRGRGAQEFAAKLAHPVANSHEFTWDASQLLTDGGTFTSDNLTFTKPAEYGRRRLHTNAQVAVGTDLVQQFTVKVTKDSLLPGNHFNNQNHPHMPANVPHIVVGFSDGDTLNGRNPKLWHSFGGQHSSVFDTFFGAIWHNADIVGHIVGRREDYFQYGDEITVKKEGGLVRFERNGVDIGVSVGDDVPVQAMYPMVRVWDAGCSITIV
jgi:hypothetical protein